MNAPAALGDARPARSDEFVVEGVHCAACIAKIERGLAKEPGVHAARVNFSSRRVRVDHDDRIDDAAIEAALDRIGFAAHRYVAEAEAPQKSETRRLSLALAVAAFAAMNVMLLSVSVWSGAEGATRQMFHWLSALIALPAIAFAGRPFFTSAWGALRRGQTNMDVPIAIGVILVAAMSLYETVTGGHDAYFDSALMLLFFLLVGRLLDSMMRTRAADAIGALNRLIPDEVTVLTPEGGIERRRLAEVAPGMRLQVAAGERFAVDGVVLEGRSSVDRAMVTGESAPEVAGEGDNVLAGTINLTAPLIVRAKATGEQTGIARIARLMEAASQSRSRYVRIADRAARLYAPAVHLLALLATVGWLLAGASLHHALLVGVAVLIITCPCALGLAVPISQVVAAGALMRAGVLVTDGAALERLTQIDAVLLDKTGTVTVGRPEVVAGLPEDAETLAALAAAARASNHPLSRAVAAATEQVTDLPKLTDLLETPGQGMSARLGERRVLLGRLDWVDPALEPTGDHMQVAFRLGDRPAIILTAKDPLRADARTAIDALKALGLPVTMLSGDSPKVVSRVAAQLGIESIARLSPEDKHDHVARHPGALMVGDGINDGPALRAASVAMAPSTASDVGRHAADLVFFGDTLSPVPVAIRAARRTMTVVRQNFALAVLYNVIAVPLALAGLVNPLVAAISMSASSLLVVANALRLRGAAR